MRGCKVQVDDEIFDTLSEAAQFLEMNIYDLSGTLTDNKEHNVNGFVVKRLGKRRSRLGGQIYCYKTGKLYKNALVLGKLLRVNPGYISKKLKTENKYEDVYGNTYRRVQNPENFKNYKVITDASMDVISTSSTKVEDMQEALPVKVSYENKPQEIEIQETIGSAVIKPVIKENNNSIEKAKESLKLAVSILLDKEKFDSARDTIDILESLCK